MKYCNKCGKELFDESVICPQCGCPVQEPRKNNNSKVLKRIQPIYFMILSGICWLITAIMCIKKYISEQKAYEIAEKYNLTYLVHTPFYYALIGMFKNPLFYIAILSLVIGAILMYKRSK